MRNHRLGAWVVVALTFAAFSASTGCKRKKEYNGIGKWILGETTLREWGYVCQEETNGMAWCQANPLEKTHSVSLGGQSALVGTLFSGVEQESVLVEIVLEVSGCNVDSLKRWVKDEFGKPSDATDSRMFWSGRHAFIAAKVPSAHASCQVLFVDANDKKRIAELKAEAKK